MAWVSKWQNNFNCGTNGTTISTANSGGTCGSAINRALSTDIGAGNTAQFSNAWSLTSGLSLRMVSAGTNRCQMFIAMDATYSDVGFGFGFHYLAAPTVTGPLVRFYNATTWDTAGGTGQIDIQLTTGNNIFVRDNVAAVNSSPGSATLIPGNDYWFSFRYNAATNDVDVVVYPKGSTTPRMTLNFGIPADTVLGSLYFGNGTPTNIITLDWDDMALGTGGIPPRPDITNAAPVTSVVGSNVRVVPMGSTVNDLSFTATDTSAVSSLTAAVTSRPAGSTLPTISGSPTGLNTASAALTGTATFAALGTYVVTATAVDDAAPSALSSQATITVDTYPPQDTATWIRAVEPGTDVQYGSQTDLALALTDGNATTGIQTQPTPTGAAKWIQTGALPTTGISARISGFRNGSGTLTRHVELYKEDKTTKIWETKASPGAGETADLVFGGVNETQTVTISAAALALIPAATDRDRLWWRIVDTIT
jgi:hypothetical protein